MSADTAKFTTSSQNSKKVGQNRLEREIAENLVKKRVLSAFCPVRTAVCITINAWPSHPPWLGAAANANSSRLFGTHFRLPPIAVSG